MRRSNRVGAILLLAILPLTVVAPGAWAVSPGRIVPGLMLRATDPVGASTNWGGYAVTGSTGSITLVTASWVVPAVTCPSTGNTFASFWVGIDGFSSSTVEQTGTDSDCRGGAAQYYAWYEFFPAGSVTIRSMSVTPGDPMVAAVWFTSGQFTAGIKDVRTGQTFTTSATVPAALRNSAEFIVEAPLVCGLLTGCNVAALSNFNTVGFGKGNTGVALTCGLVMNGVPGSITGFPSSDINYIAMVSQSTPVVLKATPSAPTSGGSSFQVAWASAGP